VSVGWGVAQLLFSLAGMRSCRYIGVDNDNGISGFDAVGSQKSKVAFQWRFQSAGGDEQLHLVTPLAADVARRGVPAPGCIRRTTAPLVDLERFAAKAAASAPGQLQERLGCSDLAVNCNYVGIVGAGGVDVNGARLQSSTAAFEWTIQAGECEWKEEVRARVRNCSTRPIPLPSCTVTHERLHGAARAASQAASDLFGFEIRCVYPAACYQCWGVLLMV
jgi:hypothetical protein